MRVFRFQGNDGNSSIVAKTVGVLAVSIVAVLVWLSADPEAHEYFHHDAGHEEHHCVITSFAIGEGFYLAPKIAARPAAAVFAAVHLDAGETLREPVAYFLLPICGPPLNGLIV